VILGILEERPRHSHIAFMKFSARLAILRQNPVVRYGLLVLGCLLMLAAPLAGLLPGPGGIFVFAIGLGLALRNSIWAKRRYVSFKKQQPKIGGWADWGMRRPSAKRRGDAAKQTKRERKD
jgi:hypothetical protein